MEKLSIQMWMAIVFVVVGFILHLISFATPFWNIFETEHWGLWQRCSNDAGCENISEELVSDVMATGRGLQVVGLLAYVALIVCIGLYVFWRRDVRIISAGILTAFMSLFSILLGAIMWASATNTSLTWCYHLCYVSGLAVSAAGGVLIHIRRRDMMNALNKENGVV